MRRLAMQSTSARVFLFAMLLGACDRSQVSDPKKAEETQPPTAPKIAPYPVHDRADGKGLRKSDSQAQAPRIPKEHGLVSTWSRSINARDYAQLSELYAEEVVFYGKKLPRGEVLALKKKVLEADGNYHQTVTDVRVEKSASGFTSRFTKIWEQGKKSVQARLVFEEVGGKTMLTTETDETTDASLRVPVDVGCGSAAFAAAEKHPEVLADRERVAREHPHAGPGGLVYEETATSVDGVLGYNLPWRFDPRWWLEVKDGKVTLRDTYTGDLLMFSPEVSSRVQKACSATATRPPSSR